MRWLDRVGDRRGMAALTEQQAEAREHDTRSIVAVVVSGVVVVALLVAVAGVIGALVDVAGWAAGAQ